VVNVVGCPGEGALVVRAVVEDEVKMKMKVKMKVKMECRGHKKALRGKKEVGKKVVVWAGGR